MTGKNSKKVNQTDNFELEQNWTDIVKR